MKKFAGVQEATDLTPAEDNEQIISSNGFIFYTYILYIYNIFFKWIGTKLLSTLSNQKRF